MAKKRRLSMKYSPQKYGRRMAGSGTEDDPSFG
jgi:hypothetical protein